MDKYYVSAILSPKKGKEDALKVEMLKNIPTVRSEKGCLRYDLHTLKSDGTKFLFYEIWADKAALEAHGISPHMKTFIEKTKDLLAAPLDVTLWSEVDVI